MKIIKEKSVVIITDDDDKYLNAFPAASFVHLDPRKEDIIRDSSSADPEREDECYFINYKNVIQPFNLSREQLFKILISDYFNGETTEIKDSIRGVNIKIEQNTVVLNNLLEQQMETNKILRKIYNPK
jgi:hypothetical protein